MSASSYVKRSVCTYFQSILVTGLLAAGLYNPQSFLTAVMQTTARRNDWPLDKTVLVTEVTKKLPEQLDSQSRDGAFVHGLTLEGARWDEKSGMLEESRPKELFCQMPVNSFGSR